jgi:hypothetical protein
MRRGVCHCLGRRTRRRSRRPSRRRSACRGRSATPIPNPWPPAARGTPGRRQPAGGGAPSASSSRPASVSTARCPRGRRSRCPVRPRAGARSK